MNHYTTLRARAEAARADVDMARDKCERLKWELTRNSSAPAKRRLTSAVAEEFAAKLVYLSATHEVHSAANESSQQQFTDDSLSSSPMRVFFLPDVAESAA